MPSRLCFLTAFLWLGGRVPLKPSAGTGTRLADGRAWPGPLLVVGPDVSSGGQAFCRLTQRAGGGCGASEAVGLRQDGAVVGADSVISSPEIPFFFWLCWVFMATWLFSRWEGGGFSLWRLLLLRSTGSGAPGMWDLPRQGTEPMSPALAQRRGSVMRGRLCLQLSGDFSPWSLF